MPESDDSSPRSSSSVKSDSIGSSSLVLALCLLAFVWLRGFLLCALLSLLCYIHLQDWVLLLLHILLIIGAICHCNWTVLDRNDVIAKPAHIACLNRGPGVPVCDLMERRMLRWQMSLRVKAIPSGMVVNQFIR